MYNVSSSSPSLINCTFTENSANYGGGMFNNDNSSPTLTDCAFTNNSASEDGGGIYNSSNSPTLNNCTFTSNSAYTGGGMYNDNSSPTLANCILCQNLPNQIEGVYENMGGNCLSSSCEDQNGNGFPDTCDRGDSRTLHVPSDYATVEAAVDAAGYGDVVLIEAGTYSPSATIDPQGKPVTIRGAVGRFGEPATVLDGGGAITVLTCTTGEIASTVFENLVIKTARPTTAAGCAMTTAARP